MDEGDLSESLGDIQTDLAHAHSHIIDGVSQLVIEIVKGVPGSMHSKSLDALSALLHSLSHPPSSMSISPATQPPTTPSKKGKGKSKKAASEVDGSESSEVRVDISSSNQCVIWAVLVGRVCELVVERVCVLVKPQNAAPLVSAMRDALDDMVSVETSTPPRPLDPSQPLRNVSFIQIALAVFLPTLDKVHGRPFFPYLRSSHALCGG